MDDPASLFLLFFASDIGTLPEAPTLASTLIKIALVALLVFLNGFFVAAEFAFVGVRRSRIEALAAEGHVSAKRLLVLLDNLNAYLSASQLGITLASLGLGALGEPVVEAALGGVFDSLPEALASWRHWISYGIAFAVITTLHIVFGEQAPKLFGLKLAEKVAMATALPMQIFYTIFKLPIHALDWASARVVRVFGIEATSEHASTYTEDEIRHMIRMSQKSGHVNEEEQRLIDQVFEFSETTVEEAMIPRTEIVAVQADYTLEEVAEAFRNYGYSRLPVYRGSLDDIAGIVHVKDVLSALTQPATFDLASITQKPQYVVDTARLEDVLRQMQREKFHFGFVVDEHGGVEGIITLEDLLEEIVGDISDEHDTEVNEQIHQQPDGSCVLDGGLAVRDLNKRLGLNIPISEGYTTIAGFLMAEAGRILNEGESVPFNGHVFRVEKAAKRRILEVRLEPTKSSDPVS
ncbi:MAG: hemolysin family protein [Pyrinomonadaceae bacterium]